MIKILLRLVFGVVAVAALLVLAVSLTDTYERDIPAKLAGYHTSSLTVDHRETDLPLHIWYPAEQGGTPELIAQNALFFGEHILRDAPPAPGAFPLVVLSHGSGGNGAQLSWLATALAKSGNVVIATDHPGTRSRDSDPHQTVQIWHRARDMQSLIDAGLAGPLGLNIAPDSVTAIGYSLGGPAALQVAGLRYDKARFIGYCAEVPDEWDCGWFNENGVDFEAIDAALYSGDYRDPRVTAVITIDSALAAAAQPETVAALTLPALLINMEYDGKVPAAMLSDKLAADLPNATYHLVPDAWHFSFLQNCSLFGKTMIAIMSSENICKDLAGRTRTDVHKEIIAQLKGFLVAQQR